jgi:hypothetical protein
MNESGAVQLGWIEKANGFDLDKATDHQFGNCELIPSVCATPDAAPFPIERDNNRCGRFGTTP